MRIVTTIAEFRAALEQARAEGASVGLVPTMGYLHAGHTSLIQASAAECDLTAATIFVNPLQFAPEEDLDAYPRDLERDRQLAEEAGAGILFTPDLDEMYPSELRPVGARPGTILTSVSVDGISQHMEGESRPTHFAGVATVVAKLFFIAGPCRAYFGEKDYQQLAVVRRMAADLSAPVTVVGCPTVREPDGLAMSSRNAYLTPAEREAAPVIHRALQAGKSAILAGEIDAQVVRDLMSGIIDAEELVDLDYSEVVEAATLVPVDTCSGDLRLLAAARVGKPRLLDNLGVTAPAAST